MYRSKTHHSELQLTLPLYNDIPYESGDEYDVIENDPPFCKGEDFKVTVKLYEDNNSVVAKKEPAVADFDEFLDLTDQHVETLHQHLLNKSLQQLFNDRSSVTLCREVLAWINRPYRRKEKQDPFSFSACAILSGYNPETLQDSINEEILDLMLVNI